MAERADVVVVGGGVFGSSVALHLLEAGAGDVRLVERDGLSQGTSAAGAGFVAPWAAMVPDYGPAALAAEHYGIDYYAGLDADGYDIDFAANGMLWVAPDQETWALLVEAGMAVDDDERRVVGGAEIERLTGGAIPASGVAGAVFLPSAVQVSAGKAGPAMADRFVKQGGTVNTRRPVTGLLVEGSRVVGVETATGVIECDAVVLASGAWTNELLRPLGVYLPATPVVTSRIVTEPLGIPETMPMLFLLGLGASPVAGFLWVRGHHGRLLWGGHYETQPRHDFVDAALPERFDQLALDGVFDVRARGEVAARFMPALGRYESMTLAHGVPCFTPDGRSLVGEVPGVEGLWAIAGDNEAGVTHAPGFGKALADHLVNGDSDLMSLEELRIDRFGPEMSSDAAVVAALGARYKEAQSQL